MFWKPIINERENYKLVNKLLSSIARSVAEDKDLHDGLFVGDLGKVLFLCYYCKHITPYEYKKSIRDLINSKRINDWLNYNDTDYSFAEGLIGKAWGVKHLLKNGFIEDNNFIEVSDSLILNKSVELLEKGIIDFLYGGLGGILYFLEKEASKDTTYYITRIIDTIEELSIETKDGIYWKNKMWTDIENVDDNDVNLGLAHGVPSVIILLSHLFSKDYAKDQCYRLITKATTWLLRQELAFTENNLSMFSYSYEQGTKNETSRLAWCYGDLGIATAFWYAGKSLKSSMLISKALDIFGYAAKRRDLSENSVEDAAFCHGTIGIMHIFNRVYQETNDPQYREAATYWLHRSIDWSRIDQKSETYSFWSARTQWTTSPALLDGISGIGLSLLSCVSYTEPQWDRCVLLS